MRFWLASNLGLFENIMASELLKVVRGAKQSGLPSPDSAFPVQQLNPRTIHSSWKVNALLINSLSRKRTIDFCSVLISKHMNHIYHCGICESTKNIKAKSDLKGCVTRAESSPKFPVNHGAGWRNEMKGTIGYGVCVCDFIAAIFVVRVLRLSRGFCPRSCWPITCH